MIGAVDAFLAAAYAREVVNRVPLSNTEFAALIADIPTSDLAARQAAIRNIPAERCFITARYRDFLARALAARS